MTGCYNATGTTVSGGEQAGTRKLHNWLIATYGGGSFGIYNPASRVPSGALSLHAEGRAMDHSVPLNDDGLAIGTRVFNWCVAHADAIGLQEIQFNRHIWTAKRSSEGVRYDSSPTAALHRDHVHIGQCWAGARGQTSWYQGGDTQAPTVSQGVLDMAFVSTIARPATDVRPGRFLAAWALNERAIAASGRIVKPGTNTDVAVWDAEHKRHVLFWPPERAAIVGVEKTNGTTFVVLTADGGTFDYSLAV